MQRDPAKESGLVYSTEGGRMCPACRRPLPDCRCAEAASASSGDGIVRVSRETKGRGGKAVTVIRGIDLDAVALAAMAKRLKATCGAGGTVKDGIVEVQGDHCERVIAWLTKEGLTVKKVGVKSG